ncbi:MAG TPA: hypothetical protein ENI27_06065 [bacterium]|nr:hypothetical protein [bacterium]
MSVLEVINYSLGVEIDGDQFIPLIRQGSRIPVRSNRMFTTTTRRQSSIEIHVLQGEDPRASKNISLGRFLLSGIRDSGRGEPRIQVTFHLDPDGILQVTAKDLDTGGLQTFYVTRSGEPGLNQPPDQRIRQLHQQIKSMIQRIQIMYGKMENRLETSFQAEIEELVERAQASLSSGVESHLKHYRLALEVNLGELQAVCHNAWERHEHA